MSTIWKFPLPGGRNTVEAVAAPADACFIRFGYDPEARPSLWAIVEPAKEQVAYRILVVGTGQELPLGQWHYLSSFHDNHFMWHVFWEPV
jgi:hypothetical protein